MFYAWIDGELLDSERKLACVARPLRTHPALPLDVQPTGPTRQPTCALCQSLFDWPEQVLATREF